MFSAASVCFVCQCVCLFVCLFVYQFVSMFVRTITSEGLNVGRPSLAVRNTVQICRPSSKVKVKGQRSRSPGTKTKNCRVSPIDSAQ